MNLRQRIASVAVQPPEPSLEEMADYINQSAEGYEARTYTREGVERIKLKEDRFFFLSKMVEEDMGYILRSLVVIGPEGQWEKVFTPRYLYEDMRPLVARWILDHIKEAH